MPDLGSRPRKIDLSPRMSNFISSPNPSKSPLWNVLKVTLEPSGHLVWSWGPPGGHGLVGHLTHFQIFLAFFQSRIKKNSVHGRWVIGPLNRRISAQGIRNWSQIIFYFPSCWGPELGGPNYFLRYGFGGIRYGQPTQTHELRRPPEVRSDNS